MAGPRRDEVASWRGPERSRHDLPAVLPQLPLAVQLPDRRREHGTRGRRRSAARRHGVPRRRRGARACTIERVIETHFHADFLSGHLELAAADRRGDLLRRAARRRSFPIEPLDDGDGSRSATSTLEIRERPATRPSRSPSSCTSAPTTRSPAACSPATRSSSATSVGPTCWSSHGLTADDLARTLYRSLHATAPDAARRTRSTPRTAPARRAASNSRPRPCSTIGEQRRSTTRCTR